MSAPTHPPADESFAVGVAAAAGEPPASEASPAVASKGQGGPDDRPGRLRVRRGPRPRPAGR